MNSVTGSFSTQIETTPLLSNTSPLLSLAILDSHLRMQTTPMTEIFALKQFALEHLLDSNLRLYRNLHEFRDPEHQLSACDMLPTSTATIQKQNSTTIWVMPAVGTLLLSLAISKGI